MKYGNRLQQNQHLTRNETDTLRICCYSACTQPPPPPSGLGFPVMQKEKRLSHPLYSLPRQLSHTSQRCSTLLCSTTTLRWSPLSHVSMALHMLQILSNAGAWWSGQPNSTTFGESFVSTGGFHSHLIFLFSQSILPCGLTLTGRSSTRSG